MNRDQLISDLSHDEGLRLTVYDDATGHAIAPGLPVKGHPSIGIGRALDVNGITVAEAQYLLSNDIDRVNVAFSTYPWFTALDDIRQNVILNMAFNLGVAGVLEFHDMIRYLSDEPQPRYGLAASAMEDSNWYRQVGARAVRLATAMRGTDNG
jgi:lysozyme